MGWMGKVAKVGGAAITPLLTVGDYVSGKQEGEDDIRAGIGAAGSGLGGWGGAAAGAAVGTAIMPGVGTAVGGIVGGIGGSIAGGWTGDRADELVRGNAGINNRNGDNKMATMGQPHYDYNQQQNSFDFGDLVGLGALGYAGNELRKSFNQYGNVSNPMEVAARAKTYGATTGQAYKVAGNVLKDDVIKSSSRAIRKMPVAGKVVAAGLGLKLLDDFFGNPVAKTVGGVIDAATGDRTDFDGKGRVSSNVAMNDPRSRATQDAQDRMIQEQYDMIDRIWNRQDVLHNRMIAEGDERARNSDYYGSRFRRQELRAQFANNLLEASRRNVPMEVQTVMNSRYY